MPKEKKLKGLRRSFDGMGSIEKSPSFKILLSSLLNNHDKEDGDDSPTVSKAERREKRRRQVKSLDSSPVINDVRFVDKPTTDVKHVPSSFGGNNNKVVAMSPMTVPASPISLTPVPASTPVPSAPNTRPNSPREMTYRGGESPRSYSQNAILGLGLQQNELRILKKSFDKIDEDKNGIIDKLELLHALGVKDEVSNLFVDKVFDTIDFDGDDGINFDEFIQMSGMFYGPFLGIVLL